MNCYNTLGISPYATADEVRQAYLALAKKYHPDKNKSPEATDRMAEINLAYETLCDGQKRRQYNIQCGIAIVDAPAPKYHEVEEEEDEELEQEASRIFGKCVSCNFVNSSGVFVCTVCGHIFVPEGKATKKAEQHDDEIAFDPEVIRKAKEYHDNDDDISIEEIEIEEHETAQENLSEIIRCPQCNEINKYSRGSCWQCGLQFEIDEVA